MKTGHEKWTQILLDNSIFEWLLQDGQPLKNQKNLSGFQMEGLSKTVLYKRSVFFYV
jgi:hypothetical protein